MGTFRRRNFCGGGAGMPSSRSQSRFKLRRREGGREGDERCVYVEWCVDA